MIPGETPEIVWTPEETEPKGINIIGFREEDGWFIIRIGDSPNIPSNPPASTLIRYQFLTEPEEIGTVFEVGSVSGNCKDTVEVAITVTGTEEVNGLLLHGPEYDENALELIGVKDFGTLVTGSLTGENSVSEDDGLTVNLGFANAIVPEGHILTLVFRIKDDAEAGEYGISFETAASSISGKKIGTELVDGKVTVTEWVQGDFNGDGEITMDDAVYFIGWINYPYLSELYSLPYHGNVDFNGDGTVDLNDAVYFIGWINYPYLPDMFPINW